MKRIIPIFLILLCVLSGCRTQKQINGNSSGDSIAISNLSPVSSQEESSVPQNTESAPVSSEKETVSQAESKLESTFVPSSQQTSTEEKPKGCSHTYSEKTVPATCVAEGYTQYTCTKCGHIYKNNIPAGHNFMKYLCDRCGKIDPSSDVFWAVNAWLSKYGQPNGKGNMNCYPNDFAGISVANYIDQKGIMIEYCSSDYSEIFSLYAEGKDYCTVSYHKGSTSGSYEIKSSTLSSSQKIVFDDYYTPEDNPIDMETFASECAPKIDKYLLRAQNEILYPKMGLKLKDFGFNCYN